MKKIIPFIILTTATGCTVDGVTNSDEKLEHKIAKALEQNKTPHEDQHPVNIYVGQYPTTAQHAGQHITPQHVGQHPTTAQHVEQHSTPQHVEQHSTPQHVGQYPTTAQHVEQHSTPQHVGQYPTTAQHVETPSIPAPPPIPKNLLPSGLHGASQKDQGQMLQKQSNLIGELNNTLKKTKGNYLKPSIVKSLFKSKKGDQ
ncbi:hypothetical protein [Francisella sp. 19X1-34]|uniref:hypothetical protein n=1 Tax=Francisella sp. 19X1-34 TaxID=3087177 RepID=UPI002E374287|nr:hypothetical protein [Francisella sp. 19X1-34]MED7787450.1 hypothetical protein [Francisella sp. 19X1-34]